MEVISQTKVAKECRRCGELEFLERFLERNARFPEETVERYWNESKRSILCDACLSDQFRNDVEKVDKLLTPVAIATLCFGAFCLVFFPLFLRFLDEIVKPFLEGANAWIFAVVVSSLVFALYVRATRPFEQMWRKIN